MFRFLMLASFLLFTSTAMSAPPPQTEFITGEGLVWAAFGRQVDLVIDVSQLDPNAAEGFVDASFLSFPSHLIMTLESTEIESVEVDRRLAEVSGLAQVINVRTGFEGEVAFNIVFEDAKGRKKNQPANDSAIVTVFLPDGAETFAGSLLFGDVEVGTRK